MDQAQLASALQAECLHFQKVIEDFDARLITIKTWSVTFGLIALVGAFVSHVPFALLLASAAGMLFWTLEVQWKFFQLGYYACSSAIEAHFRGAASLPFPFQIGDTWYRTWSNHVSIGTPDTPLTSWMNKVGRIVKVALWPHVMLQHVFVAAGGIVLFMLVRFDIVAMSPCPPH
jgi:hypothetical protein